MERHDTPPPGRSAAVSGCAGLAQVVDARGGARRATTHGQRRPSGVHVGVMAIRMECLQWFDPMMETPPGFDDVGMCSIPL